ncbi:MAG: hypothetical protein ACREIS_02795 [Nitrospiraceae bacterium]
MSSLRLIPGAISQSSVNALLLAERSLVPTVTIESGAGPAIRLQPQPFQPADESGRSVDEELVKHGVQVYTVKATNLTPTTRYQLTASAGQERVTAMVETWPAHLFGKSLTVAFASCYYDDYHRDAHYLAALKSGWIAPPSFKVLAGDNLYLDVPMDVLKRWGGYRETVSRYVRYFWTSGYAEVLGFLPTFTTSDDHEFWNNYPEWQPWLRRSEWPLRDGYIQAGKKCLELFQWSLNLPPRVAGGAAYSFAIPPLEFFVADIRVNRTLHRDTPRRMMPEADLTEFEAWAQGVKGPGVFVLGQPLWIKAGNWKDYNPPDFEEQYARIWTALAKAPHEILVVSGDVHHSHLLELGLPGRSVYEFVTSPACHIPSFPFPGQGRSEVEFPEAVPLDSQRTGALKPRLIRYVFGTDAQNSFGLLHFSVSPAPAGRVTVGAAFIDAVQNRPAVAVAAKLTPGGSTRLPQQASCLGMNLFALR